MSGAFPHGRLRGRQALTIGVFVAALAFHASYAFHGLALFDEGLLADGAWRVRLGERIGRDLFVPYGPGSYWVVAPCFALLGQSLATLRLVFVVVQAAADAALCGLALRAASPLAALLGAALLAVAHGSLHKSFLLAAAILALLGARALARKPDGGGALRAGAFAGTAFLLRHDAGAFALVALLAGAAVEADPARAPLLRRLVALALGFTAVVAPAFLALVSAGMDVGTWWDHEWQRIAVQEAIAIGKPGPALTIALIAAPLLHLVWGGGALLRRWRGPPRAGDAMRVAAALFGLLLLNQARLVPSVNHLFQASAPVALALADLLGRRAPRGAPPASRRNAIARHVALAALVAGTTIWAATGRSGPYSGTFKQREGASTLLDLPAGGVYVERGLADALRAVVATIQQRVPESGTLATSPGCPLLGFLSQRHLALPYAEPSYYYFDPRFQHEAIEALERTQPLLFVSDGSRPAGFDFEQAAPLVAQYFAQRYRPVATIGPFVIAERQR